MKEKIIIKMYQAELYQDLFNFLLQEHDLILTIEQMDEIIHEAQTFVKKFDLAVDDNRMDLKQELIDRLGVPKNWDKYDYLTQRYSFDDMQEVLEDIVQKLNTPAVVGQSEQLPCSDCAEGRDEFAPEWECPKCRDKDYAN